MFPLAACAVALAAKSIERADAIASGAIHGVIVVLDFVVEMRTGHDAFLRRQGWYLDDTFVIVVGGAIVGMLQQPATSRPSNA
jgi:hypothetical protein